MKIGIIGGSGLDDPDIMQNTKEIEVENKFGKTILKTGTIKDKEIFLIGRHGKNHTITPTYVNYRANIFALKENKVDAIIATTACGSMREEIKRGDFVITDQFIDFTKFRKNTFFENFEEEIKHTPMAEPFDEKLRDIIIKNANQLNYSTHSKGTVITIEGPRFSTKAESHMFRSFGADIINMSVATEVTLANEMEIPYAAIAMVTDFDCWKEDEESVSWEKVLEIFNNNAEKVKKLIISTVEAL